MRIVVISDSHRNSVVIKNILDAQPEARHIFFLGDNTGDIEDYEFLYPDKIFYTVSGNCDFNSPFPSSNFVELSGKKIFFTHGHTLNVKYTLQNLINTANKNECQIALYGHTHISKILYDGGIYIVNPGSCSLPRDGKRSYAVIDITKNGIMPIIIEI